MDGRIATLAARQHGVVTREQLRSLGLGDDAIDYRVQAGRLHRLHRGVFAVGHVRLSRRGHWLAAVLACGADAVLSHHSAAALWELRPTRTGSDVTVPLSSARGRGLDLRFESDRARDAELQLAGYRVLRFTYRQVTERPRFVARAVRTLLARGG